jgi:glycosyltransferase involved in cell wall biosynthesis
MTRFAVIITNYNYARFVVEAVDSVLAQSRPPARILVVDDGSTDGSQALLTERYGNLRDVQLLFGENRGQLAAFQRGVSAVDSEVDVVCFLDADDHWQPRYLEKIGTIYDQRKDIGFVFSDINLFGNEEGRIGFAKKQLDIGYTSISTYALTYWYGAPTSALSLRLSYARLCMDLPHQLIATWRISADNCLVFGASIFGARKYFLPTAQVDYRIHGDNGWWAQQNRTSTFLGLLRSRGLIAHYAHAAGMDDSCLELAKLEYQTKPDPDWGEARRYIALCWRARAPWWKRLERILSILRSRKRSD